MKTVTVFNTTRGVGITLLVYHLAWMFRELGYRVIMVDLDPQSNLTSAFLEDEELEKLWPDGPHPQTILGALDKLINRLGDMEAAARVINLAGMLVDYVHGFSRIVPADVKEITDIVFQHNAENLEAFLLGGFLAHTAQR